MQISLAPDATSGFIVSAMKAMLMQLKIGELAKRTGLSIRALHHYDSIGLLSPSQRSAAGARVFTAATI